MSSIETIGLGAGSYPEQDLEDTFDYEFTVLIKATVKVNGKNEYEAREILESEYTPYEIASDSEELEIVNIECEGKW